MKNQNIFYMLFLVFFVSFKIFSQDLCDPKILILSPNKINLDKKSKAKLETYQKYCIDPLIENYQTILDSLIESTIKNDTLKTNDKQHYINQLKYIDNLNYSNYFSYNKASSLQSILSMDLPNVLVKFSDIKSTYELQKLNKIADSLHVNYILNYPEIQFKYNKGKIILSSRFQLYDYILDEIVYDEFGEVNQYANSTTTCNYGKKKITILHAGTAEFSILVNKLKTSGDQDERLLEKSRISILDSLYYLNIVNAEIKRILIDTLTDIDLNDFYIGLFNNDKTKFIAFIAEETPTNWSEDFSDYILTVYLGSLKRDIWNIEKLTRAARVDESGRYELIKKDFFYNLRKMDYFKENSTERNMNFWDIDSLKNKIVLLIID